MWGPASPAESAALMGPVGPTMSLEVLPLSDLESADPVMLRGVGGQTSSIVGMVGPVGPVGTLVPEEDGPGLCHIGLPVGLLPAVVVPLPAGRDPTITLLLVEGLERNCAEIGEESIAVHGGWSDPDVARIFAPCQNTNGTLSPGVRWDGGTV